MISPKALQVIEVLYKKTMSDLISWGQTVDDGIFQIAYPNFTIKIFTQGIEGNEDITLRIYNENAQLIEEITDNDISTFEGYEPPEGYKIMKAIYNKARAQALGVEKVINDILSQLGVDEKPDTGDDIPF